MRKRGYFQLSENSAVENIGKGGSAMVFPSRKTAVMFSITRSLQNRWFVYGSDLLIPIERPPGGGHNSYYFYMNNKDMQKIVG